MCACGEAKEDCEQRTLLTALDEAERENERLREAELQERIIIADQSKEIERLREELAKANAFVQRNLGSIHEGLKADLAKIEADAALSADTEEVTP
jgi:hypothetical protein